MNSVHFVQSRGRVGYATEEVAQRWCWPFDGGERQVIREAGAMQTAEPEMPSLPVLRLGKGECVADVESGDLSETESFRSRCPLKERNACSAVPAFWRAANSAAVFE